MMYFRECNDTSLTVYSTVALCKSFNHEDVLAHCWGHGLGFEWSVGRSLCNTAAIRGKEGGPLPPTEAKKEVLMLKNTSKNHFILCMYTVQRCLFGSLISVHQHECLLYCHSEVLRLPLMWPRRSRRQQKEGTVSVKFASYYDNPPPPSLPSPSKEGEEGSLYR